MIVCTHTMYRKLKWCMNVFCCIHTPWLKVLLIHTTRNSATMRFKCMLVYCWMYWDWVPFSSPLRLCATYNVHVLVYYSHGAIIFDTMSAHVHVYVIVYMSYLSLRSCRLYSRCCSKSLTLLCTVFFSIFLSVLRSHVVWIIHKEEDSRSIHSDKCCY